MKSKCFILLIMICICVQAHAQFNVFGDGYTIFKKSTGIWGLINRDTVYKFNSLTRVATFDSLYSVFVARKNAFGTNRFFEMIRSDSNLNLIILPTRASGDSSRFIVGVGGGLNAFQKAANNVIAGNTIFSGGVKILAGGNTQLGRNIGLDISDNGGDGVANYLYQMGFHYGASMDGSIPAVIIGAKVDSPGVQDGKSAFFIATRDVTTNTVPTYRFWVNTDGTVNIGGDTTKMSKHSLWVRGGASADTFYGRAYLTTALQDSALRRNTDGSYAMFAIPATGGIIDTTSLSARINLKKDKIDSTAQSGYTTHYQDDTAKSNLRTLISTKGSGTVTSVTATYPIASTGGTTPVISTDTTVFHGQGYYDARYVGFPALSTWAGTSNITTVGTIGTGTWQGTPLATSYIANSAVTLGKMADMATASLLGRNTAGTGAPEVLSASTAKTLLSLVKGDVGLGNVDNTSNATERAAVATLTNKAIAYGSNTITGLPDQWVIAISDETTAITTGTAKVTFRAPYAATVTGVRASVNTASSSGIPTFDINESGTTIMATNKLTIDASEKTSTTAATAAGVTDTSIADDAEMTIDIDVAGTGAKGAKIIIYVTR